MTYEEYLADFETFLIRHGYSEKSAIANVSLIRTNDRILNIESSLICDDPDKMRWALETLRKYERINTSELQNALKLLYYYDKSEWFDSWISPKFIARTTRNNEVCEVPSSLEQEVPDYEDEENWIIQYDKSVPHEEKIKGLISYLEGQYEHLVRYNLINILDIEDIDVYPFIPIILSNETPKKTYTESDEYLAKKIDSLIREPLNSDRAIYYGNEGKSLEEKILEILKIRKHSHRILGEYHHDGCPHEFIDTFTFPDGSRPYITLYYKNLICSDVYKYEAIIDNAISHEYFHFVHDYSIGDVFYKKSPHRDDVIEALADFFSIMNSIEKNKIKAVEVAREKYDSWVKYFGSSYPYANALYFYYINGVWYEFGERFDYYFFNGIPALKKFNAVFRESHNNMEAAYEVLTTSSRMFK